MADENANPGRYGFSIIHPTGTTHWFSSEEQIAIREWMKALMKATIGRDYTKPVMSSVNIPTIPLAVAQAMSPAPRPPSPTQRDATQRALRRDNPNQLSDRDAQVLMALPTTTAATATPSQPSLSPPTSPTLAGIPAPNRPARDSTRPDTKRRNMALEQAQDAELISWINKRIPNSSRKATNMTTSLATGLVLYRLAESLKTNGDSDKGIRGGVPNVPDSVFSDDPGDDKLDGLFVLFDFLLDNDVRIGNVTINDVRSGDRDQLVVLVKALRAWGEKRSSLDSIFASKQTAAFGPFIGSS
ncbi:hypothetical protein DL93DRAFT_2076079 [Clavulina sp. PMI_390]|nr:hypothetical protein DL93DRAFT_2076079 [Clavulina sp. PMI_390]